MKPWESKDPVVYYGSAIVAGVFVAWILFLIFAGIQAAGAATYPNGGTPPATVITEDSPKWDCHTMGNHQCGTLATTGSDWDGALAIIGVGAIIVGAVGLAVCSSGKRNWEWDDDPGRLNVPDEGNPS